MDEQQARDLLTWDGDIGTLEGCNLRFKLNQLGCLELLDSDEESENQNAVTAKASIKPILPGSSLLRDGPNNRRQKPSNLSGRGNHLSLLKKLENSQNSILLDKLVPKQKLDKIKTTSVESWTIEDVKKFIDSIPGCSGHGELFESHQICGKSLMYLDQRDLLDVINVKLGPAVKICHAISLLK